MELELEEGNAFMHTRARALSLSLSLAIKEGMTCSGPNRQVKWGLVYRPICVRRRCALPYPQSVQSFSQQLFAAISAQCYPPNSYHPLFSITNAKNTVTGRILMNQPLTPPPLGW